MKSAIATALLTLSTLTATGTIYPQTFVITNTDYENNVVTISTCNGFERQFEGVEDYLVGDLVSCIMFDNFTPGTSDDIVISQTYSGITRFYDEIQTFEGEDY